MNRRSAIRCSLAVTAGIILLPSCLQDKTKPSVTLRHIDISAAQEGLLADLSEAIIPKTATPGANELSSHLFVLMMVDDCYDPGTQKQIVKGLVQFGTLAEHQFGASFRQCTKVQKEQLLRAMENKAGIPEEALVFYNAVKRLTIQSFTTSQYYLTKIHVYEMVPARFHGCVPVSNSI